MKAIILAAGQGTRIKKYTEGLPKGMLQFKGKTIIERQIETYKKCGINDIVIVKGYACEKINYDNVKYYTNEAYESTNMVESLLCAKSEFTDDIIVSYSDILFEERLLRGMINSDADYGVSVDKEWKSYWLSRYGKVDFDTESLSIDGDGNITELGLENPDIEKISARYIGLLKFSKKGLENIVSIMEDAHKNYEDKPWQQSGKVVKKAYMTDLLNALIESGEKVRSIPFEHGWVEFDTNEDYEKMNEMANNGKLEELIKL